jgi:hypothetical protein
MGAPLGHFRTSPLGFGKVGQHPEQEYNYGAAKQLEGLPVYQHAQARATLLEVAEELPEHWEDFLTQTHGVLT